MIILKRTLLLLLFEIIIIPQFNVKAIQGILMLYIDFIDTDTETGKQKKIFYIFWLNMCQKKNGKSNQKKSDAALMKPFLD